MESGATLQYYLRGDERVLVFWAWLGLGICLLMELFSHHGFCVCCYRFFLAGFGGLSL